MQPPLLNARNIPLNQASSNLPDVSATVRSFLYPMTFEKLQNTLVNGYAQNVIIKTCTLGCIQPFTPQMLKVKPEGERNWKWYTIHALTDLVLQNNDQIKINSVNYKIMERLDYYQYGYVEYHAIEFYVSNGTNNS